MGHPIIMGRKTYESIGRPLPGRTSIVITRQPDFGPEGVVVVDSLERALQAARELDSEVFVIGGGEIYAQALSRADRVYLTKVLAEFPQADTFFPELSGFSEFVPELSDTEEGLEWEYGLVERIK